MFHLKVVFRKYELLTITIPGRFSLGALGRRRRRGQEQFHLANVSVLVDGTSIFGSHTLTIECVHWRITRTWWFYSHVCENDFFRREVDVKNPIDNIIIPNKNNKKTIRLRRACCYCCRKSIGRSVQTLLKYWGTKRKKNKTNENIKKQNN